MQVKFFEQDSISRLEKQVNDWLRENQGIDIQHILQSQSLKYATSSSCTITLSIFYR